MKNMEIKTELMKSGMKNYELAELLGIADSALSRKLRKELPDDEKQKILKVIHMGKQSNRSFKDMMKDKGISNNALAHELEITPEHLCRVLNGKVKMEKVLYIAIQTTIERWRY